MLPYNNAAKVDPLRELKIGGWRVLFDSETLFTRCVRWNGIEVLRAIYGAVRNADWETIRPELKDLEVKETADEINLRFSAECVRGEIDFRFEMSVSIHAAGELQIEFSGEARSDFLRNRIGLCALLPVELCAGRACQVRHSDGTTEKGFFPALVAPLQPFLDIRTIRYAVDDRDELDMEFAGEVFEMEDQRNWTDASYKIYGTPLAIPFPKLIRKGEKVRQQLRIKIEERPHGPEARWNLAPVTEIFPEHIEVQVNFDQRRHKPAMGIGFDSSAKVSPGAIEKLRAIGVDHVRVDCRFEAGSWTDRLSAAGQLASSIGAALHVAVFSRGRKDLENLAQIFESLKVPVKLWLIFDYGERCTRPESMELAEKIFGSLTSGARFAAGTDANFAELNRQRPPAGAAWHSCFSINPQVHATDDRTLIENLDAQGDVVLTGASFTGEPMVISPVTLLPRFNPVASTEAEVKPKYDPRHKTLFGAGWTLGSIATLSVPENVLSLTYFEATGPGGLVSDQGDAYPMYHVFLGLSQITEFAQTTVVDSEPVRRISALSGVNASGSQFMWVANHTASTKHLRLEVNGANKGFRIRSLRPEDLGATAKNPGAWWEAPGQEVQSEPMVELSPWALTRIQVMR